MHYPVVVLLSCLGVPCQAMMLALLRSKHLFSPTNLMLMSLSAAQLMLLLTYLYINIYKILAEVGVFAPTSLTLQRNQAVFRYGVGGSFGAIIGHFRFC